MKPRILIALLCLYTSSFAQITVSVNDFATAGDTVRISQTTGGALDFATTGANVTWDFSSLTPTSQYLKQYNPIGFASILVFTTYGPLASTNYKATYFNPTNDLPLAQLSQFLPVTLSDLNQYTKRMADSITSLGYSISVNGQGVPFKSDTIETRYKLPLSYNDNHFSRGYTYIDLNPVIDFKIKQYRQRSTSVDGWGTLITPKGTFQTLRLRHDISEIDSVYQTFFGAGTWFGTPPTQTTEYEWFANGEKEWLLKAIEVNGTINSVEYQQDYLGLDAGLDEAQLVVTMGPNPVTNAVFIQSETEIQEITLVDPSGKEVLKKSFKGENNASLDLSDVAAGSYQLRIKASGDFKVISLIKL